MWSALTFKKMITIFLYLGWQNLQPSLRDQYLTEACHCIFQALTINFFDVEVFFFVFLYAFALSGRCCNDSTKNKTSEDSTDKGHLWRELPGSYWELAQTLSEEE